MLSRLTGYVIGFTSLLFASVSQAETLSPHTLFIAGDSTAATYSTPDHQGWAGVLQEYFDSSKVTVDNRARGGRSARTFISEGHWQKLIDDVKPGDWVFIQFGHNDAGAINDDSRARGTIPGIGEDSVDINNLLTKQAETVYSFGHYIRQMVADVRAKQAYPVLMSLTVRNIWRNERIERGSGQYGGWMYQLAWELNTPFIDVTNPVADALENMGKVKAAELYTKDHTHFNPIGAYLHADTIVAAIKGLRPTLDTMLYSKKGTAITSAEWTFLRLPFVANANLPSVFFVGDSTVRNGAGDGSNGQWGWGDFVKDHLNTKQVNIVNRAVGGLSSRTFVTGGHWQRALNMMQPGDTVVIQFGHNDNAPLNDDSRARGTIKGIGNESEQIDNMLTKQPETVHSYGWYLRKMIGEAMARGVRPIICSPVPRKTWDDNNEIVLGKDSYPHWAWQVARQSGVMFIDLHRLVAEKYNALGPAKVDELFGDAHTHTSEAGAKLTAEIVAAELQASLNL